MKATFVVFCCMIGFAFLLGHVPDALAQGQSATIPATFKGQIVTGNKEIQVPSRVDKDFINAVKKQDVNTFEKGADNRYTIFFVAFFNKPAPIENLEVVVLDAKNEAVAVASVKAEKGQQTLASQITVDDVESPNTKHVLQVHYAINNKPVVLAKKELLLK